MSMGGSDGYTRLYSFTLPDDAFDFSSSSSASLPPHSKEVMVDKDAPGRAGDGTSGPSPSPSSLRMLHPTTLVRISWSCRREGGHGLGGDNFLWKIVREREDEAMVVDKGSSEQAMGMELGQGQGHEGPVDGNEDGNGLAERFLKFRSIIPVSKTPSSSTPPSPPLA